MLLIFFEIIALPFEISFDVDIQTEFELLIDCLFFVDILTNFTTGFYKNGILIKDHQQITKNYLSKWFWIDMVASFPYSRIVEHILNKPNLEDNNLSQRSQVLKTQQ